MKIAEIGIEDTVHLREFTSDRLESISVIAAVSESNYFCFYYEYVSFWP